MVCRRGWHKDREVALLERPREKNKHGIGENGIRRGGEMKSLSRRWSESAPSG